MATMQEALEEFRVAYTSEGSAIAVAQFLSPTPPANDAGRLYNFVRTTNEVRVTGDVKYAFESQMRRLMSLDEMRGWIDVISCYWRTVDRIVKAEQAQHQGKLLERQAVDVYDTWKDMTSTFMRHISNGALPHWTVFTLYYTANHLRNFAIKADEQMAKSKPVAFNTSFSDDVVGATPRNERLEEAARVFNRIFALCLGDRTPDYSQSRKWGVYCVANLLFKTYFKLKTISLSKNLVKSIDAQSDLPQFTLYPRAHRVTYMYYVGVISFLQEDYAKAEASLTQAWDQCYAYSTNKELIMSYLIPCRLITHSTVPTVALLNQFPHLNRLFGDLVRSIKKGDLAGFDKALAEGEPEFVKRRIFLTLERSRDIALRNLFRKVFLAAGYEDLKEGQTEKDRIRKSRIPLAHFAAALRMSTAGAGSGQVVDDDEVECLLANTIYKNHMKGYISREHAMVVLNKKGAFPGTGV